ncbi:MAG: hypothetical protein OXU75_15855 [Deltaproteobacteria bacterium]|nr:hypothetical protein [Deltaproteobacteria bacterium]
MTVAKRQGRVLEPVEPDDAPGAPRELLRSPGTFALRVRGDSMAAEQLRDGDLVLARSTPAARDGDTVVALVRGEPSVRQYHRRDGKVVLRSADEELAPIVAAEEEVEIRGVVVAVVRKY